MKSSKIYAGIYNQGPNDVTDQFLVDKTQLELDAMLMPFYIWETLAHNLMLAQQKLVPAKVSHKILQALLDLAEQIDQHQLVLDPQIGDVHENIEYLLTQKIGSEAGWFHLARSRNDQVTCDQKMLTKYLFFQMIPLLDQLGKTLLEQSKANLKVIMPGYTHARPAMPSTFGFWWQSYLLQLVEVEQMLVAVMSIIDICPLGAGASYGVNWPINPQVTAEYLGFDQPLQNSLASLNSRGIHEIYWTTPILVLSLLLSRMMEDLIFWSQPEVGLISFAESFTSGSSIMPQKINPDVAEKVRSKVGVLLGNLVQLATVIKGTPSGYNRDSAESKEVIVRTMQEAAGLLTAVIPLLGSVKANKEVMLPAVAPTLATKLADYLVKHYQLPFRQAHQIVGVSLKSVGGNLSLITPAIIVMATQKVSGQTIVINEPALSSVLDPAQALSKYAYAGSPQPKSVHKLNTVLQKQHQGLMVILIVQSQKFDQAKRTLIHSVEKYMRDK